MLMRTTLNIHNNPINNQFQKHHNPLTKCCVEGQYWWVDTTPIEMNNKRCKDPIKYSVKGQNWRARATLAKMNDKFSKKYTKQWTE